MWGGLTSNGPPNWKFMDVSNYSFKKYCLREAFVLENKVVYFGSWNVKIAFVLEKEEDSEQLKVVREDEGINFERGNKNTTSRVYKKEIYAFK